MDYASNDPHSGNVAYRCLRSAYAFILATPPVQKSREAEHYRKIPLTFEANQGQAEKNVKFLLEAAIMASI